MFNFFKKGENNRGTPPVSERFVQLRSIIFNTDPASQDIKPTDELPNVWAVLIEVSSESPRLTITLRTLADGSTSIYASEGAAFINIGDLPEIADVAKHVLPSAEKVIAIAQSTTDFPIPAIGTVNFYIFTYSGVLMKNIEEEDLINNDQPFGRLYRAFREILHRNRLLRERFPEKYASIMQ